MLVAIGKGCYASEPHTDFSRKKAERQLIRLFSIGLLLAMLEIQNCKCVKFGFPILAALKDS